MIGILDPALFQPRAEEEVVADLDWVLHACLQFTIELVPIEEYWAPLWADFARPLERSLGPKTRRALQEIRKRAERATQPLAPLGVAPGKAWRRGFSQLFGPPMFDPSWEECMAAAVLRALATGMDVVVLTRRIRDRNLTTHSAAGTTLDENTRWVLHLHPRGLGPRQVLCIHNARNLTERWTARFDWRLPAAADGARYPFCPPDRWWRGSTVAIRTVASKPAWIDRRENGWSRPNIPGGRGYHWDVHLRDHAFAEEIGVDQLNITAFGAPLDEGPCGGIHHIPETNRPRMRSDPGWRCE